ncbi:D-alanine--D-alanine ligase family protein [bacterium]
MIEKRKLRVALLFGGRSTEHEVSLSSALGIYKHINKEKYEVLPVKISTSGKWTIVEPESFDSVETLIKSVGVPLLVGDSRAKGFFRIVPGSGDVQSKQIIQEPVDVVFPILHGTFGEDGTIQGLLATAGLPCVGAGVTASAIGMDKVIMKQIFFQNDLPSTDFMWFLRKDWKNSSEVIKKGVGEEIGFPCFIKPANAGSSVGVFKAHSDSEFSELVSKSIQFDRKILVEKAIDARELECSVLGNDDPQASVVGEIIPCNEFYDYEAKYVANSRIEIPAKIPKKINEDIRQMAITAFKAIDCAGMGRVDFLMEKETGQIFVNEINTIPGFTPISMYPKLWEASGTSYSELIGRLIDLAVDRWEDLNQSQFRRE